MYNIVILLVLGQIGAMVFYNWFFKSYRMLKQEPKKFFYTVIGVAANYFFYTTFFTKITFQESVNHSIFWIPLLTFSLIDFCVPRN